MVDAVRMHQDTPPACALASGVPAILWTIDACGVIIRAEGQLLAPLGLRSEQLMGRPVWEALAGLPDVCDCFRRALAGEELAQVLQVGKRVLDARFSPLLDSQGQLQGAAAIVVDGTQRQWAEYRLRATRDLLGLFVRGADRQEYLRSVVDLLRDWSGCENIGIRLVDAGRSAAYRATRGFAADFLASEGSLDLATDNCICTRVIRAAPESQDADCMTDAGSFVCNDTPRYAASISREQLHVMRGACFKTGFHSLAVVPIRYRDQTLGVIHLADPRPDAFGREVISLIETAAPLIGEAVHRYSVEESLRQTNELLERTFASAGLLAAHMDCRFNFLRVNRSYAEADGRSPEWFIGRNHFDLYPNEENERIFREVIETGQPHVVYDKPFVYAAAPQRGVTWWDWSLQPVKDAQGRVDGLVLSLVDRTDRVRAQEALREKDVLLRAVFDQTFQFITVLDLDGAIREVNETALAFFGREHAAIGLPFWEVPGWSRNGTAELVRDAVCQAAQGRLVRHQLDVVAADGMEATIDFSVKPVRDTSGRIAFLLAEGRDITESKRLERRIHEISSTEQQRIGNDLQDRLGQDLTGIACLSQALRRKLQEHGRPETDDAAAIAELARQAIREARGLAHGLCAVGQGSDLSLIIQALASSTQAVHGVACEVDCDCAIEVDDPLVVMQLYRIAQEAVRNAVQHGKASLVTINLASRGGGFDMAIRDNGVGLPTEPDSAGGLGLGVMKYRAAMIGGTLDVRRHPDGGTIVTYAFCQASAGELSARAQA